MGKRQISFQYWPLKLSPSKPGWRRSGRLRFSLRMIWTEPLSWTATETMPTIWHRPNLCGPPPKKSRENGSRSSLERMTVTLDQIYEVSLGARKMSRGSLLTFCPFHQDDSPSLLVFEDGWFRCKGAECGRTGRLETLYDALVSPSAAPNGRAEHARGRPPWLPKAGDTEAIARLVGDAHNVLLRNESFRWYLEMRGVADRVETAGLGWHEGWITVPILTDDRQV